MRPLTKSQIKYILMAYQIQGGAETSGIYFSLFSCGHISSGVALRRRKLIEEYLPGREFPFTLTKEGFKVAAQLWKQRLAEGK